MKRTELVSVAHITSSFDPWIKTFSWNSYIKHISRGKHLLSHRDSS